MTRAHHKLKACHLAYTNVDVFLINFRWIGVRLEMLGNVIVLLATIFALISNELNGAEVGLSITYAVQVGAYFYQFYKLIMVYLNNVFSFVHICKINLS